MATLKPSFFNADYYITEYHDQTYSTLEEAKEHHEGPIDSIIAVHSKLLIQDTHGQYIPQIFATNFNLKAWNLEGQENNLTCIAQGPHDNEWYWEAWHFVTDAAYYIDSDRITWRLEQDGDLWATAYIDFDPDFDIEEA